ncbi:asialoglycoprotein receptor 1-like isoform X1 [Oncorhynchus tshawytscha]|uniref:C-type lectin domain-containing protein n=1 Tax=Oncorhynchus tshawytscha TaxID=74940 RepID=A0AAZ3R1L8_ONCTS|nr:asialoglycoprotein receptor 1-like isoform X1 [Oncorhynchus tshawytscha]
MKEPGSVQGSVVMTTEYHDDFQNTDTSDNRPFWTKEPESGLGQAHQSGRGRWMWAGPVLSAFFLLALIIFVSVSNRNTDSRFSSIEKTVANLSLAVQTVITTLQQSKASEAELQKEIGRQKFTMEMTERKLDSVSESVKEFDQLESLRSAVAGLKCSLDRVLHNDTVSGCCPLGWVLSGSSSCYFFSSDGLPWNQARDYCSNYNAQLAVLKTEQDWDFVTGSTKPLFFWVGLSDERTGEWEWVDGTPYIMDRSQWKPGQPDNWKGHGLGGTEDCAMIHANGQLNDDHCSRSYRYVCQGHTLTHTH